MRLGFYTKLAVSGIRKNRKLYTPYLLTCVMMVAMFYIVAYLSQTKALAEMAGANSLGQILTFGKFIIAIFSLIFLFYTNSFLVRRRIKEYGLYNMLGMGKRSISKLVITETIVSYLLTSLTGVAIGILLSKLAELLLFHMIGGIVQYSFSIPPEVVATTLLLFALIFFLIFLNSLRLVRKAKAVELLRSENVGEKPPRSNWLLSILGVLILGAAYYLALKIEDPISALFYFFIAVIMVIVATYLLFISGSVLMCKLLQRNKSYYYNKKHFTSVSQMSYRMKRNGAGLASICILMTMVLVTISATSCLNLGAEDAMQTRYPREINVRWMQYGYEEGGNKLEVKLENAADKVVKEHGVEKSNARRYTEYSITGLLENSKVSIELNSQTDMSFIAYDKVCEVHFIDIKDYNRMYNKNVKLSKGEAVVQAVRTDDLGSEFSCGGLNFKVVERLPDNTLDVFGSSEAAVSSSMFVFIPDMYETVKPLNKFKDYDGGDMLCHSWYYEFDPTIKLSDAESKSLIEDMNTALSKYKYWNLSCDSQQLKRSDFYGSFGGLLFLGGMLSIIFMMSAVMIIYYKQVSEGYEDQKRFEIMQKIGMTKADIRSSINSQMRLLFLLPVIMGAMHLAFAFPFMNKLLMLFGLLNVKLLMIVTAVCFLVFSLLYAIAYKLTSNAYYKLVA